MDRSRHHFSPSALIQAALPIYATEKLAHRDDYSIGPDRLQIGPAGKRFAAVDFADSPAFICTGDIGATISYNRGHKHF